MTFWAGLYIIQSIKSKAGETAFSYFAPDSNFF